MQPELMAIVGQFGPAGLMGVLWVLERRHAAMRDRQLTEAHAALAGQSHSLHATLSVVRDNTRAIVRLEQTQQRLVSLAERVLDRLVADHRPASTVNHQPQPQPQSRHSKIA